jgi:hypothetical protein
MSLARRAFRAKMGTLLALVLSFKPDTGLAYRPFVSTDAAVADPGDAEIEFGYIGFRERHGDSTIVAPTIVTNLGVVRDVELVGQTNATHDLAARNRGSQAEDTEVSVKWVVREGLLRGPRHRQDTSSTTKPCPPCGVASRAARASNATEVRSLFSGAGGARAALPGPEGDRPGSTATCSRARSTKGRRAGRRAGRMAGRDERTPKTLIDGPIFIL